MANTNTSLITTLDSTDGADQFVSPLQTGGRVRVAAGSVTVTGTNFDAANDTIVLCRLPHNACILSLKIAADDMDNGTASLVDLGVYPAGVTAAASAVNADCYGTLLTDFQTATPIYTEFRFETLEHETVNNRIWQDAGLASDPGPRQYDIVMTQTASVGATTSPVVSFIIQYVVD